MAITIIQTGKTTLYQVNGITFPTYGLAYRKAAAAITEVALRKVSGQHYNGRKVQG